jgi:hypothetical protein
LGVTLFRHRHPASSPSSPSKSMVTDRHYILVNITRCAVWGLFYQIVSADLTAPHLQSVDPHVAVRPAEQIWITAPAIIVLPVSCPVVPLGPSQWRVDGGERGRWHKSRHQRARDTRVFVQHATLARREKVCTCHGPRLAAVCTCFGPSVLRSAVCGLQCLAWPVAAVSPTKGRLTRNV